MLTSLGIKVRPLSPHFGAEIVDVDLTQPLDAETRQAVYNAWIDAGILLFRGQRQDDEAQMQLSRIFGEIEPAATAHMNDADNPYMMTLAYDPGDTRPRFGRHYNIGGIDRAGWLGWHWDQAFMPTIVRGAVLRMTHPSPVMGETGFIDAIQAYDRLSDAMKARIEGLSVVYKFTSDFMTCRYGFPPDIRALPRAEPAVGGGTASYDFPPTVHPLVITQVETGRKVLKLSPMHSQYVLGMNADESHALLTELADHLVDPAFAYFHSWQENDMVVWDNWRMIHCANGVPLDCFRSARRTTIAGDYKVGRYLDDNLDRDRAVTRLVD